jgi:hypothetical protein
MRTFFLFIIGFVFFINSHISICQEQYDLKKVYKIYDSVIGKKNLGINNGVIFKDNFITESKEKNHRFFEINSFQLGNIVYNNQPYFDIFLKYDLFEGDIIAKILYDNNFSILKLEREKITEFSIANKTFVNASFFEKKGILVENGFYQKLYASKDFSLFKTSHKNTSQYIADNKVYNKFYVEEKFFLMNNSKLVEVESKKDFKKILPNTKGTIYAYFRKNRKVRKIDTNSFYIELIKTISVDLKKKS